MCCSQVVVVVADKHQMCIIPTVLVGDFLKEVPSIDTMLRCLCVYRNFSFARRLKLSVRMEARLISFSAVGAAYLAFGRKPPFE